MLCGHLVEDQSWYVHTVTNWQTMVRNWHFSADPKPVDMVWGTVAVADQSPPWRRDGASAASSGALSSSLPSRQPSVIARSAESSAEAASPWKVHEYVDKMLVDMRENRQTTGKGTIPSKDQDPIRDMCHEAYQAWCASLYENIWPNIVGTIQRIVGEVSCGGEPELRCYRCGGTWDETGGYIKHNLFGCMAEKFYEECPFDEQRWETSVMHPFRLPYGGPAITEVMRYYGTLLNHADTYFPYRHTGPQTEIAIAAGQGEEKAVAYWSRSYKNQRRYMQRQGKRAKLDS